MNLIARNVVKILRGMAFLLQVGLCALSNLRRSLSKSNRADYILFEISGPLLERASQRHRFLSLLSFGHAPALTIESLRHALGQVAADPDVRGVLFLVKGAQLSLAQAQTVANLFERFRSQSQELSPDRAAKEVVVFLETCANAEYMMAAAADRVFLSPRTTWMVLGLRAEPIFLAESLRRLGIEAEVVKVAPWKTAFDTFSRSEISAAHRQQLELLLDSWYQELISAISRGRDIDPQQVRSAIHSAPLTAADAIELGLIDGVAYEDQLSSLLAAAEEDARILLFAQAAKTLYRRPRLRHKKSIGVLSLSGMITSGKSRSYPADLPVLGKNTVGSATVQQMVRAALENKRLAGVLLHIDSNGGSVLASDLIWRELTLLNRTKPVVAYLGDVAASGGYYVALPAQRIVCQPTTLTGSIGVIMAKFITAQALGKIGAGRASVQRGANADIYASDRPWRPEQRDLIEEQIDHIYQNFVKLVADARQLSPPKLEDVCGGRVWTGRQAQEHGLVDEVGDFDTAIDSLCELAELPLDGSVPVVPISAAQNRPRPPLSERGLGFAAGGDALADLPDALLSILQGDLSTLLGQERSWLFADGLPKRR